MSKSPHTPEFRAQVSQEYLDRYGSYNFLAAKYNIGSKTLQEWVAKYKRIKEVLMISLQSTTYLQGRYSGNGL